MPLVDDRAIDPTIADQNPRHLLDRLLSRRKPNPLQTGTSVKADLKVGLYDPLEPLQRQREMGAAAAADHRVNFVDDHRADRTQHLAASRGCQEQVQRFGRRHQDVRRFAQHGGALGRGRIACSDGGCNARRIDAERVGQLANAASRLREVLVNVGAQRLERRDVDDPDFVGERLLKTLAHEVIDGAEKCGERLPRSGRRGDERVPSVTNRRPAALLRRRRRA